jgi:hypothetical protein
LSAAASLLTALYAAAVPTASSTKAIMTLSVRAARPSLLYTRFGLVAAPVRRTPAVMPRGFPQSSGSQKVKDVGLRV